MDSSLSKYREKLTLRLFPQWKTFLEMTFNGCLKGTNNTVLAEKSFQLGALAPLENVTGPLLLFFSPPQASRSCTKSVSVFPSPSSAKEGGSGHSLVGSQGSVRLGKLVMISKLFGASVWQNT